MKKHGSIRAFLDEKFLHDVQKEEDETAYRSNSQDNEHNAVDKTNGADGCV